MKEHRNLSCQGRIERDLTEPGVENSVVTMKERRNWWPLEGAANSIIVSPAPVYR